MTQPLAHEITQLLEGLGAGNPGAEEALATRIYEELRMIARSFMSKEKAGHTLQPTALAHEAFLRLRPQLSRAENRRYLFAAARTAMRRVLIDHARRAGAAKRALDPAAIEPRVQAPFDPWHIDLVDALDELAEIDPRQHQIVWYRFFFGLTMQEIADLLGLSLSQIEKDWRFARAWLYGRLDSTP